MADSIAGRPISARPSYGVAIVSVFGLAAASVGASEKQLRAAGRAYRAIHTHPQQHTGYYPGARPISLKLLVDPVDDAILGAQAVGMEGADKRIDVIATAMSSGRTASELAELELAYAPQFGSAKDPVNMLGYVNENLRDGLDRTIQWHELEGALAAGARLIDVRARGQLSEGSIPGSAWIPVEELRARADEAGVEGILDQVTARAVSALSKLIPMTAPLLRPGGELILLKGERVAAETEAASKVIRKHRLRNVETLVLGDGMIPEVTRVFRATVD